MDFVKKIDPILLDYSSAAPAKKTMREKRIDIVVFKNFSSNAKIFSTLFLFCISTIFVFPISGRANESPPKTEKAEANLSDLKKAIKFLEILENDAKDLDPYTNKLWIKAELSTSSIGKPGYSLHPELDKNSTMIVRVKIDPKFLLDPVTLFTIKSNLAEFSADVSKKVYFADHRQWAETYWNAMAGDVEAQLELKKFELHYLKQAVEIWNENKKATDFSFDPAAVAKEFKERQNTLEKEVSELNRKFAEKYHSAEAKWKADEPKRKSLESASEKLDDLLKKNDRKGVSRLIRAFLPWHAMPPIEKNAWLQWLDSIENPRTDEKGSTVLFRGLDLGDRVFQLEGENPSFMSTMLTKNQGNYTRRLRSYRANRYNFGTVEATNLAFGFENRKGRFPLLTSMMSFHAIDPVGTPFLSFSDLTVARNFATKAIVAVKIDSRRVLPNSAGPIPTELERLIPMVVFPDEIIHYSEIPKTKLGSPDDYLIEEKEIDKTFKSFQNEVEKKLGRKLKLEELGSENPDGGLFKDKSFRTFIDQYVKPLEPAVKVPISSEFDPNLNTNTEMLKDCKKFFSILE